MSEFLEVRCGLHRLLVPSSEIDAIEVLNEYLFCVRPRRQLALECFAWRRRIRQAAMAINRAADNTGTS